MRIRKDKSGLDATVTPSDLDIAWAAGVYEGEGSCGKNGSGGGSFSVVVSQKDPELLYRLRDFFGGSVNLYNAGESGRFLVYQWALCGNRGRVFLGCIYPFLTSRRKAQIDATSARVFLDHVGHLPRTQVCEFVKEKLAVYLEHHLAAAKEADKRHRKEFYERQKASNPSFMAKRREMTRNWRRNQKSKVVAIA